MSELISNKELLKLLVDIRDDPSLARELSDNVKSFAPKDDEECKRNALIAQQLVVILVEAIYLYTFGNAVEQINGNNASLRLERTERPAYWHPTIDPRINDEIKRGDQQQFLREVNRRLDSAFYRFLYTGEYGSIHTDRDVHPYRNVLRLLNRIKYEDTSQLSTAVDVDEAVVGMYRQQALTVMHGIECFVGAWARQRDLSDMPMKSDGRPISDATDIAAICLDNLPQLWKLADLDGPTSLIILGMDTGKKLNGKVMPGSRTWIEQHPDHIFSISHETLQKDLTSFDFYTSELSRISGWHKPSCTDRILPTIELVRLARLEKDDRNAKSPEEKLLKRLHLCPARKASKPPKVLPWVADSLADWRLIQTERQLPQFGQPDRYTLMELLLVPMVQDLDILFRDRKWPHDRKITGTPLPADIKPGDELRRPDLVGLDGRPIHIGDAVRDALRYGGDFRPSRSLGLTLAHSRSDGGFPTHHE